MHDSPLLHAAPLQANIDAAGPTMTCGERKEPSYSSSIVSFNSFSVQSVVLNGSSSSSEVGIDLDRFSNLLGVVVADSLHGVLDIVYLGIQLEELKFLRRIWRID